MKLADLLSDMIANGATMEQVAAVVESSRRQEDARGQRQRELSAERQRNFKARKKASNAVADTAGNAGNAGNDDNALSALPSDALAPTQPLNNLNPKQELPTKNPPKGGQKGKVSATPRTRILPDAQPTEVDRTVAAEAGMDAPTFRHEWSKYRDWHIAEGSTMADWSAAWRKWVTNWIGYGRKPLVNGNQPRAGPYSRSTSNNPFLADLLDHPDDHPQPDRRQPEEYRTIDHLPTR